MGSSPDDDFHLASIWCGLGEREGLCEAGTGDDSREVNRDLVVGSVCYAYAPERSGPAKAPTSARTPPKRWSPSAATSRRYTRRFSTG